MSGLDVGPAFQVHVVGEKQVALGLALAHQQQGVRRSFRCLHHLREVEVAQNVDIVDEYGRRLVEERQGLLDAATRLEQSFALVADADVEAEVAVGIEVVDNLLCKMMHVDHDALESGILQFHDDMMKQRLSSDGYQCLWHRVGKGFQAGSQPCRKDHCLLHGCKVNTNVRENKTYVCFLLVYKHLFPWLQNLGNTLLTMMDAHLNTKLAVDMLGQMLRGIDTPMLTARATE